MARLLLLLLLPLSALAQSGKYQINTVDTRTAEGTVSINPYYITIDQDSTQTVLPVTDVGKDKQSTYYILGGCKEGRSFVGYAMLTPSSTQKIGGCHRHYSALYIEIRARQLYSSTKFSIYYDSE